MRAIPIIRRPRPHVRDHFARAAIDAFQTLGEQCILLSMFHAADEDDKDLPKSENWDPVYQTVVDYDQDAPDYGNAFDGGVKEAFRVWSIWTENTDGEQYSKRGEYLADKRDVQTEAWPEARQHDYLIRVRRWTSAGRPLELYPYRYVITSPVTDATVHTGAQLSQTDSDRWGQKFSVSSLPENHPIYGYEVDLTQVFPRKSYPPYSA